MAYDLPDPPGRALHEPAARPQPNEPETGPARHAPAPPAPRTKPQPQPLLGQTVAGDGALAPAAAVRLRMPDLEPC